MPRQVAHRVINPYERVGMFRTIGGAKHEDRGRGPLAERNAIRLGALVFYPTQVFRQPRIEARRLRREERSQRVMRGLTDGGRRRKWAWARWMPV